MINRRAFLANTGSLSLLSTLLPDQSVAQPAANAKFGFSVVDPRFHGARGDGRTNDRIAIQSSIDECASAGGGIVYIAPGTYLTGMLVLKSNVTLYLETGATILGSKNVEDYLPHPGMDAKSDAVQKRFIYARKADNVAICGFGTIDGQGTSFWTQTGKPKPADDLLWRSNITWEWEAMPRPASIVEFVECTNVRVEGITLKDAAMYTLRAIASDVVFIHGIRIRNPVYGVNTDGIDVFCSQNVLISDCDIATGDDAICLKSEIPFSGSQLTRNIVVTNCVLTGCCNGFKIGTGTNGGMENITFSNSVIENREVPFHQRIECGIALEMVDGGWLEGINIANIRMQRVRTPIFIRRGNRTPRKDGTAGTLRGVMIDSVHATGAIITSSITGIPGYPVEDVSLSNIRVDSEEQGKEAWVNADIPEQINKYPTSFMFGRLPASGLYCRHAAGLRLNNVEFHLSANEKRPAFVGDDIAHADISGLRSTIISGRQPVVLLKSSSNVWLREARAPEKTETFLEARGKETSAVVLSYSDMTNARQVVSVSESAPANAITQIFNIPPKQATE
jgi:polygalacturonase